MNNNIKTEKYTNINEIQVMGLVPKVELLKQVPTMTGINVTYIYDYKGCNYHGEMFIDTDSLLTGEEVRKRITDILIKEG